MGTWYIAKTGNDTSGNGTSGSPWKTLNKAVESVPAGTQANPSVIIVKNGTYNLKGGEGLRPGKKNVVVNKPWITIKAETMRQAILHGDMEPGPPPRPDPANLGYIGSGANGASGDFIAIARQGICIDGLTIECIGGAAIGVGSLAVEETLPDDIVVQNCQTYWTMGQGINVYAGGKDGTPSQNGKRTIVRNNRCVCGSVRSITAEPQGDTPDPSTATLRVGTTEGGLVENNIVEHSFGEGLDFGKYSAGTAAAPCILRGNIVHDSSHAALYLVWNRHVHVYNNIVYHTKNSGAHSTQSPHGPGNALAFRDEGRGTPRDINGFGSDWSTDYYAYNNLMVNGDVCFQQGGQRPVYFGFNTLVTGWFTFNAAVIGDHRSYGIFENNVIVDAITARRPIPPSAENVTGWKFARDSFDGLRPNAWSYQPDAAWRRAGDIYGTTSQSGPVEAKKLGLVNPTRDLVTTGWGWNYNTLAEFDAHVSDNFNVEDYHLLASSPARDRAGARVSGNGITVPALPFQQDYRGATRSTPDMGFHEASGQITVHVEADYTAVPGGTALETGTNVAYTNESVVTGTTTTGYLWTVKRGTATQATASTTNFSYTFPSAGSYTVALEVQTPEGNDTHTVSYTITDPVDEASVDAVIGRSPAGLSHPVGTTISFTDNSTFHLCSFVSRQWEVRTSPGGVLVASSTLNPWSWQFLTAGTFTVKLTVNASGGLSDNQTLTYTITAAAPTVTADFTAGGPLTVEAGTEIDFTNTSSATGTTIIGNTWSIGRRGSGTSESFITEDVSYVFNEAGLWDVQLRVDTAAGISGQKTMTVTVMAGGDGTGGTDFAVVPHLFALATSTGIQTVTAAALGDMVPVGVHLKVVGATVTGTAADGALWSEGAASTGSQWCYARYSADGQATTVAGRARSSDDILLTLNGTAITGRGSFVRFVPGGMEIDITDAPPAAYLAEATFYAGESCQFRAGEMIPGTVGAPTRVETGIAADALYVASCWAGAAGVVEPDAELSRGWAVRDLTQLHFRNEDRHAQATTTVVTRHINTRIGSSEDGEGWFTSLQVTAIDATGFTIEPKGSSLFRPAGYFVFATGGKAVHLSGEVFNTASPSEHPLPLDAQTVMALVSTMRSEGTQLGGIDAVGQGWWIASIHGVTNQTLSIAQADDAADSATSSLSAAGFRAVNHDTSNVWNGAATLSADGVSVAWTAAPSHPYRMILLAVEKGEEIEVTDLPVAAFEVEFDIDPRSGRVAGWFNSDTSNGKEYEITSYLWEFGDGETSTVANPFHLYLSAGIYDVSLTVTTEAGSNTTTKAALVTVTPRATADYVLTLSYPQTSGGRASGNALNDNWNHTTEIRFDNEAHFRALRGGEVTAFVASPPDDIYALVAYDQDGHRFLIKETDGAMRVIGTTAY